MYLIKFIEASELKLAFTKYLELAKLYLKILEFYWVCLILVTERSQEHI